jgi:hypothetical protein
MKILRREKPAADENHIWKRQVMSLLMKKTSRLYGEAFLYCCDRAELRGRRVGCVLGRVLLTYPRSCGESCMFIFLRRRAQHA